MAEKASVEVVAREVIDRSVLARAEVEIDTELSMINFRFGLPMV